MLAVVLRYAPWKYLLYLLSIGVRLSGWRGKSKLNLHRSTG